MPETDEIDGTSVFYVHQVLGLRVRCDLLVERAVGRWVTEFRRHEGGEDYCDK
jgi:hypothetical protein